MRALRVLLLCVLGAALLSSVVCSSALGPDDCCFSLFPRRVNKVKVRAYYMTDFRCPTYAAILVTQNARHLCVDPNLTWVQGIMKSLDEKTF